MTDQELIGHACRYHGMTEGELAALLYDNKPGHKLSIGLKHVPDFIIAAWDNLPLSARIIAYCYAQSAEAHVNAALERSERD